LNGATGSVTWPMVRSAVPLLVTVIVSVGDSVATVTSPNGTCWSSAGSTESVTVISGSTPVPLRLTVTVALFGSFDGISMVSLDGMVAVGSKRTVTVQLAVGSRVWFEHASFSTLNGATGSVTWLEWRYR